MSIMRISADYRADGMERAVVGFDNDSGRWTLEEGYVTATLRRADVRRDQRRLFRHRYAGE